MKKFILLIILLPFLTYSQLRDSIHVYTDTYEVMYSETKLQPLWVKYNVKCSTGNISRQGLDFYTNDSIKTSTDEDYINNQYDKGHMAPAADFNCNSEWLKLTFSYLNCALQNQSLNRGVWKSLEKLEREWSSQEQVKVTITVKFDEKGEKLPSGALIPVGFYKTIYLVYTKKTYKYYFPNKEPKSQKINYYLIK